MKAIEDEMIAVRNEKAGSSPISQFAREAVKTKWVFTIKDENDDLNFLFKAPLVAKRLTQQQNILFFSKLLPCVKLHHRSAYFANSVGFRWHRKALNVQTTRVNADLEDKIYVCQPRGFEDSEKEEVNRLCKAFYGLEQACG